MYQTLLKPLYKDVEKFVLDTLFPIHCIACGKDGKFVCELCANDIALADFQKCIACQKPAGFGLTHPSCLSPHTADALISIFDYRDERMAKIIIHGKYYWLKDVFKIMGKKVAQQLKAKYPNLLISNIWSLVPIPLHPSRKRWRGFNQAEILCEAIAEELNLPIANLLIRKKSTKTQKDLKRHERIKNVSDVFALSPEVMKNKFSILNHSFLLIDDVATTGATLSEATKVLKRNGAGKVICLTVARD